MPTAARLVAAISFGLLAFLLSSMMLTDLPPGTKTGWLWQVNCIVGIVAGWRIMGTRANGRLRTAIGGGLTTAFAGAILGIFAHSLGRMVSLAMRGSYKDGVEAVVSVFEIGFDWALVLSTPELLATLAIGGVISGYFTHAAALRWR